MTTQAEALMSAIVFIARTAPYLPTSFDSDGLKIHAMLKEALAQPEHSAPHGEPVAQDRDLHSHMMVVASRAVDAVTNNGRTYAPIKTYTRAICKAIQADKNLLAKLAPQPKEPEQEPVAWAMLHDNGDFIDAINPEEHARIEGDYKHALYTTPPQRNPLTDEMVTAAARELNKRTAEDCGVDKDAQWKMYGEDFIEDARAMLTAAHGIKE